MDGRSTTDDPLPNAHRSKSMSSPMAKKAIKGPYSGDWVAHESMVVVCALTAGHATGERERLWESTLTM